MRRSIDKGFLAVDFPNHLSDLSVFVGHDCGCSWRFAENGKAAAVVAGPRVLVA